MADLHDSTAPVRLATGIADDFDLDGWIDGTCGMRRTATLYQNGDLFAELDELERELAVAKKIPKDQRGLDDRTPEQIKAEMDAVAGKLLASALTVTIQDSTAERRRELGRKLKEQGIDPDKKNPDGTDLSPEDQADIRDLAGLHMLAASIIKVETSDGQTLHFPDGFPFEKLQKMQANLGETGLANLWDAYARVTTEAPNVAAPLSRRSSSNHGGIT